MLRFFVCLFLTGFGSISAWAETEALSVKHVIYITFDGTRWQDIFLDHTHFKKFFEKYAQNALFYGNPDSKTTMETASIPVSLPSYQSQMAGNVQPCGDNDCGRIEIETLPENLKQKLGLLKKEVAIFGSWYPIAYSAEHIVGNVFINTGNAPVYDPDTGTADAIMHELNYKQSIDHPDDSAERYDRYTVSQAMHYFEKYQPRFIWIALNDSDEYAHQNNIELYHKSLSFYDDVLDALFTKLKSLKLDKNTMVIVTTDHGRGDGDNWTDHGPDLPESKRTWAFVMNGHLQPLSQEGDISHFSTLSIRPAVELAMGVQKVNI